jgi:molecular chaperone DnaJ
MSQIYFGDQAGNGQIQVGVDRCRLPSRHSGSTRHAGTHGRSSSTGSGEWNLGTDNAYAELGLTPGASEAQVKAAWRRLVSQWHPDRNKTSSAVGRMQRINKAYEQIGLSRFSAGSQAANARGDDETAGPQSAHEAGAQGPTIRRKVRLTLEEAALGCTKVLRGKVTDDCTPCDGRGFRVLGGACAECEGAGVVRQRAWYGWLSALAPCGACGGERVARQVCHTCEGVGRRTGAYRRTVRFPPGVRHGDVLCAEGGRLGDLAGALELRIELSAHKFFVLSDDGILRCEIPVDGFAWIANRWIDVPTLTGIQKMRLRREHHVYRLRGQGFPIERRGDRGDYVVNVVPIFPESLSAEQDALLDQLIASSTGTASRVGASPVRSWQRTLQTWERSLRKDGGAS